MEIQEKIKPVLNGSAETMLQSFYARAQYSKSKKHKFYDAKAVELVEKIDYDFTDATKDSLMSYGVIARTLVFDELVKAFIDENPNCTVVNIACGSFRWPAYHFCNTRSYFQSDTSGQKHIPILFHSGTNKAACFHSH
ncbi:MAG: class I SAM-dependent methyltransferase, partial [Anaerococcus sp.]